MARDTLTEVISERTVLAAEADASAKYESYRNLSRWGDPYVDVMADESSKADTKARALRARYTAQN